MGRGGTVLIGVPYDGGNRVDAGARHGPTAVRAAWRTLGFAAPGPEPAATRDLGDLEWIPGQNGRAILEELARKVRELQRIGVCPLLIGGDHSISRSAVAAAAEVGPLTVVWLDAHTDFSPRLSGREDHRQVLRRICELPGVQAVVHVGHRGFTVEDEVDLHPKMTMVRAGELRRHGPERVVEALPEELPCYVSLDVDVVDPAFAPATATPVPGGSTPRQVRRLLIALRERRRIVGFDLVELNPAFDLEARTSLLAASLIRELAAVPMDG